jgi:hypothetical protein
MRVLWTLLKVALVLALVIPVSIIVLVTAVGILGALFALAVLTLRIAVVGLIVWGAFRLITALFRDPVQRAQPEAIRETSRVDPHYEAAMRELDQELGHVGR